MVECGESRRGIVQGDKAKMLVIFTQQQVPECGPAKPRCILQHALEDRG